MVTVNIMHITVDFIHSKGLHIALAVNLLQVAPTCALTYSLV